ncbi:hypothetical protein Fcan01_12717 [Folsomia candida]|uniref:Uncharacterized protein n=1 Tax=Folsomia candida TaxID=158441 RepID=A0A226E710_FOLCA|nr:hypothetical protein Fcan01_12717 [Folsomia candida]
MLNHTGDFLITLPVTEMDNESNTPTMQYFPMLKNYLADLSHQFSAAIQSSDHCDTNYHVMESTASQNTELERTSTQSASIMATAQDYINYYLTPTTQNHKNDDEKFDCCSCLQFFGCWSKGVNDQDEVSSTVTFPQFESTTAMQIESERSSRKSWLARMKNKFFPSTLPVISSMEMEDVPCESITDLLMVHPVEQSGGESGEPPTVVVTFTPPDTDAPEEIN